MANLVNAQTNQVEQVPQDSVQQALASGSHNLIKGQSFNVMNPDGELVSLPSEQIPDALSSGYSIPSQEHISNYAMQQKYGEGVGNEVKAFGLGALSGATFGGSNQLLKATGAVSPEALHEIPNQNPISYGTGQFAGAVGSAALAPEVGGAEALEEGAQAARTLAIQEGGSAADASASLTAREAMQTGVNTSPVGMVSALGNASADAARPLMYGIAKSMANPETSPIVAKILSKISDVTAKTLGSAVEGAAYGLGNAIDENAIGNSDLNAESIMHNVGYGALYGGALGSALGLVTKQIPETAVREAALKDSILETAMGSPENPVIPKITSIDDLKETLKAAKETGFSTDLPQKAMVIEGNQILAGELKIPFNTFQLQSLDSPANRLYYKTMIESPGENGELFRDIEAVQKQDLGNILDKQIKNVSPDSVLTSNPIKGGDRAVDAFTGNYKTENAIWAPFYKKIDSISPTIAAHPEELLNTLDTTLPGASQLIQKTPEGYEIAKYKTSLPISKEAHIALTDLVDTLNEPEVTIGGIRSTYNAMRDKLNLLSSPRGKGEVYAIRRGLMDYMTDQIQKALPESEVVEGINSAGMKGITPDLRTMNKAWAINAEARDTMEKIFGGSISDKATFAKEIKSENVLDRIFSSTVNVRAAKELLGPHFDEALANYLSYHKELVTDAAKGGFSSNKFATFLKDHSGLDEAMIQHPEEYSKMHASTNLMRTLPDSPKGNPSVTAATNLMQRLQKLGGYLSGTGLLKLGGDALNSIASHFGATSEKSIMDQILSGKTDLTSARQLQQKEVQYGAFSKIERFANTVTNKISKEIKPLLQSASDLTHPIKGITIQKLTPEDQEKKFQKTSDHLQDITQSPEKMIDQLQAATQDLHGVAPQIAGSLNTSLSRATQYLATIIPQPGASSPLSEPYKVSPAEIYKFNRTMEAVEKPLSILKHAQQGTLTMEAVKAVQTVYPQIYSAIQTEVTNQLSKVDVKDISYKNKLILSMLTGQDMTNSLKPSNIMSAQTAIQPSPSQQPVRQSQAGLKNLNRSQQMLTANQASAQREKT